MNLKKLFIDKDESIKSAMEKLDLTAKKILIVTEDKKLLGVITDGDIRRWILKNGHISMACKNIMNREAKYVYEDKKSSAQRIMRENIIQALPVLNKQGEVVDIVFSNDKSLKSNRESKKINTPVVMMAGGRGSRLYPYTKILPKPLIPIGETPISERIIDKFHKFGCKDFYLTVNYKKKMIKAYFDDFEKPYNINYVEEEKPLGTAGSLSLLKDKLKETFFLTNCDILIKDDYSKMLNFHKENQNKITIITSLKQFKLPYGVINIDDEGNVKSLVEKPEYNSLVNTGMYIIEAEVLEDIPQNTFYHITDLIREYIEKDEKIGTYPVNYNSWLDMGQFEDLDNMMKELGIE